MTTTPPPSSREDSRPTPSRRLAGETVAWWIVFSALTLSVLGMAGLWN